VDPAGNRVTIGAVPSLIEAPDWLIIASGAILAITAAWVLLRQAFRKRH
jgi:hypothetical protein